MVFETRDRGHIVWAWCLLADGPGFDEVFFTETDGMTPADAPDPMRLERVVFTCPVEVEVSGAIATV